MDTSVDGILAEIKLAIELWDGVIVSVSEQQGSDASA